VSPPLKIVHLVSSLETGGTEMMLFKLLQSAERSGLDNSVVSLTSGGAIADRIRSLGIRVDSLNMRRGIPNPVAFLRLILLLRRERPAILQTWLYHSDLLGLIAGRLAGVPAIAWNIRCSTTDERYFTGMTGAVVRLLARMSGRPNAVVVNSEAGRTVHEAIGYRPRRWEVIPNGFDLSTYAPSPAAYRKIRDELEIPQGSPIVGLVARFDPLKDHATFLSAAGILHAANPQARFVLAGLHVDDDNTALTTQIESLGLRPVTHLLGERQDIPQLTAAFDVATCSSTGEGFPNIVGEAMACAVPVVTTDVGDARLVVGETGKVVPSSDPEALAEGWKSVLEMTPEDRAELGAKARERISSHFDIDQIAHRYSDLYQDLFEPG
jgi:glycosyltransferase involved in cell wall biosynthesis